MIHVTGRRTPRDVSTFARMLYFTCMLLIAASFAFGFAATAAEDGQFKTAGGLSVYLGVVPAEILKGPEMHGGAPSGRHEYHLVVAIFDVASNTRVSDATVTAQVSGLGLSGSQKLLEPMKIADTVTYGGYFYLPGADRYTVKLTVQRPGSRPPVNFDFNYQHGRQ